MDAKEKSKLETMFRRMFKSDTAEVDEYSGGKLFLILGFNKNTKTEREAGRHGGQWIKDGQPYDFDYVARTVVASGVGVKALMKSARHYKWLQGMTWDKILGDKRRLNRFFKTFKTT